jgi:hypothetical protein
VVVACRPGRGLTTGTKGVAGGRSAPEVSTNERLRCLTFILSLSLSLSLYLSFYIYTYIYISLPLSLSYFLSVSLTLLILYLSVNIVSAQVAGALSRRTTDIELRILRFASAIVM